MKLFIIQMISIIVLVNGKWLQCPQGKKFWSTQIDFPESETNYSWINWKEFWKNCQCDCCPYELSEQNGCNAGPFKEALDYGFNLGGACMIHDFCYVSLGRTKNECDLEFKENLEQFCKKDESLISYLNLAMGLVVAKFFGETDIFDMDLNCKEVVPIVYEAVKNYAGSYFIPKQDCPIDCHCRHIL